MNRCGPRLAFFGRDEPNLTRDWRDWALSPEQAGWDWGLSARPQAGTGLGLGTQRRLLNWDWALSLQ